MKILQVNKKFPFPLNDGESIAVNHLAQGLHQAGGQMHLFALNTKKHYFHNHKSVMDQMPFIQISSIDIDTTPKVINLLMDIVTGGCHQVERFYDRIAAQSLISLLKSEKYDVVQLESLFVTPYLQDIRKWHAGIVSIRAHNVESEIWRRLGQSKRNPLKAIAYSVLAKNLIRYEKKQLSSVDVLLPVSEHDAHRFRQLGIQSSMLCCPIGMNIPQNENKSSNGGLRIGFIGSLDWEPNLSGLNWFLKKVFPILSRGDKDFKLFIAGKHCPPSIVGKSDKNIIVLGEIEKSSDFFGLVDCLVVPLKAGSGTRVKILEAFANGIPVVSTTIGIEGIPVKNKKHAIIADSARDFERALSLLAEERAVGIQLADSAKKLLKTHFDIAKIGRVLFEKYSSLEKIRLR